MFSSLKWQILQKVIIVYGIVAIILTVFQLWVNYNSNLDTIKQNLKSSLDMVSSPMGKAIYHVNNQMIEDIFEGILSQDDILGVAVYDRLSDEFITRGVVDVDTSTLHTYLKNNDLLFHINNNQNIIAYQHSLQVTEELNNKQDFGNIIVFSDTKLAFQKLENTIILVLFNSLIKSLVLVVMFLLIFNRLLIQPLTNINNVISNLSAENLKSLRLNLDIPKSNELHTLQIRFNQLLDDLYNAQENERTLQHQSKFIAMGEMIGNIAHQWRQPLATVNMIIAILIDKQENKSLSNKYLDDKLHEIENMNIYMSDTIEDFLEFSSPNKLVYTYEIKDIINSSLAIIRAKLESSNIDVVLNIPDKLTITTNKQELMQVLIILLSNSIDSIVQKDNDNNKIEINVDSNDKLTINIKDYGMGIDENIIDRIFEPYFTQKDKNQGVGLGLYIAKTIVENSLSGTISAQNHQDGAIFSIFLRNLQIYDKLTKL